MLYEGVPAQCWYLLCDELDTCWYLLYEGLGTCSVLVLALGLGICSMKDWVYLLGGICSIKGYDTYSVKGWVSAL